MLTYASGAAFVDRTGAVLSAEAGFLEALALPAHDPTGALRARGEESPALRAFLGGDGPDVLRLASSEGELELARHPGEGGALLLVRCPRLQERLEHGLRSAALSRLVSGVAHDIKNPLNAMALQLAILSEKLSAEPGVPPVATHLSALREQIGRVNEVVRRLLDVTDPPAPLGQAELGDLLSDSGALLAHEARRRRVQLVVHAPRGLARAAGDPARVGRLVLGLLAAAVAGTPDGGRVEAGLEVEGGRALVRLSHAADDAEAETRYDTEVNAAAARALGGELMVQQEEGLRRLVLRLPRIERT